MPRRTLDHASVRIRDLDRARQFYEGLLGLEPAPRPELGVPGVWYTLGHAQLHLIQIEAPSPQAAASIDPPEAAEPSHPAVPADDTAGARFPKRSVSALRSAASAIGDRQTLPVHTMRIEAITRPRIYR